MASRKPRNAQPALRIGQAAEVLGVSVDTIRRWAADGTLQTTRTDGGQRLVSASEVRRMLDTRRKSAPQRTIVAQSARNRFPGVVTKVEWLNPHMRVYVDVTDATGKVTNWNMEMTSPNTVRRQGWGLNDLLPGEKVTFTAYGGKIVETRGSLLSIKKLSDGRELFVAGGPDASVPK